MHRTVLSGALILTAGLGAGLAQEQRTIEYHRVESVSGGEPINITTSSPGNFFFERAEMAFDNGLVKDSPYSADAVTETTQTLADGNHIRRSTKASLFRDSEGRTRREQSLGEIGPMVSSGEPVQSIMINDPVAGTAYMLNSREKVAHKMMMRTEFPAKMRAEMEARSKTEARTSHPGMHGGMMVAAPAMGATAVMGATPVMGAMMADSFSMHIEGSKPETDSKNFKRESLGTQVIEGVAAEGTRTTVIIPAGAMGNERPIEIVNERWYSPQLKTTVMTKSTDPRMGETTYTLKNVKLADPDQSLFTVPADYSIQ